MNAERLDVILPIVGSNINEQIWVKVKVSRNVPRGQVFLLSTETLEGDKIGCIYSVMIKMATTTNVQETTEDRRRQKYRKNNPKLVQLSNLKFSAKVSRKRQVDTDFDREYKRFPARPDLNEAILEPDDLDDLDE